MSEARAWFNVGAVKLPSEERTVASSVFAGHPERFYDVLGADTPDDDDKFPIGANTAYSAQLTEREAEEFSRASNCRYVELDQVHHNVTTANVYYPNPRELRVVEGEVDWYPGLTGTEMRIAVLDSGNTAAVRAVKNMTLYNRAVMTDTAPTNEVWASGMDHGNYTASIAVPYGGTVIDTVVISGDNTTTDSWVANGITWSLGQNPAFMNMSLGLTSYSNIVNDALASASTQDTAIMISTGNDSQRINRWPAYANEYMPYVHSVMASDMALTQRAYFTNYGPWQTGIAPGIDVVGLNATGQSGYFRGTSAAAPIVVNLAARIMSSGVSAKQAAAALKETVRDVGITDGQGASLKMYSMQAALRWLNKEPPIVITRPDRPQKPGLPLW